MQNLLRPISLLAFACAAFIACGDGNAGQPQSAPAPARDTVMPNAASAQQSPLVLRPPGRQPKNYADFIVSEYARVAADVPKSVSDSIIAANPKDMRKFQQQMENYLAVRDVIARKQIAARFSISVDSLARLIDLHNAEAGKK